MIDHSRFSFAHWCATPIHSIGEMSTEKKELFDQRNDSSGLCCENGICRLPNRSGNKTSIKKPEEHSTSTVNESTSKLSQWNWRTENIWSTFALFLQIQQHRLNRRTNLNEIRSMSLFPTFSKRNVFLFYFIDRIKRESPLINPRAFEEA